MTSYILYLTTIHTYTQIKYLFGLNLAIHEMWRGEFINLFFLTTNMHICSLIPIEELSVGQIVVLRKLCLVKLTALIELHKAKSNVYVIILFTPSHSHPCHPTHHHTCTVTLTHAILHTHTPSHSNFTPHHTHHHCDLMFWWPFCLSLAPGYWREESQNCPTAKVSTLIQCSSLSNLRQPDWQVTGLIPRSPYMEWDIPWEWG